MSKVIIGRNQEGQNVVIDLADPTHIAMQGQTRSGKSVLTYVLLANVANHSNVMVCGSDPTGVLFAPFINHGGAEYRASGLRDLNQHVEVLEKLCDLMDERISTIVANFQDKIEVFTQDLPLLFIVLEEYPGLLSRAEINDQQLKPAERLGPRIKNAVSRLTQEGAKVGVRLAVIAQRMDANIIGGSVRSNFGTRFTLRVDNSDAVKMLHPSADQEICTLAETFKPGRALMQQHGQLTTIKCDYATYEDYVAAVRR